MQSPRDLARRARDGTRTCVAPHFRMRVLLPAFLAICPYLALPANGIAQETHRLSVDSSGAEANGNSFGYVRATSSNGRYVVFAGDATNLVPNDTNGFIDVFVHDRTTGVTQRVSVDSSGAESNADSHHWEFTISGDGSTVAFVSSASNLVPNDTNQNEDVFVHNLATGSTERVSIDSFGNQASGGALFPGSGFPSVSSNGQLISFSSFADNLVPGDTNSTFDVFSHDRSNGVTERLSVDSNGVEANDASGDSSVSADGLVVAFTSLASNLVPSDNNVTYDVFVRDRTSGTTTRVSLDSTGSEGDAASYSPTVSADARYVSFLSEASNLVSGDQNGQTDVFVHDRVTGITERVSVDSSGFESNGTSDFQSMSSDGTRIAFQSEATNLVSGDSNANYDVFVHDRSTGETERVSIATDGSEGNYDSFGGSISGDGRVVVYCSLSTNLVDLDTNGMFDVFIRDACGPAQAFNYGSGVPGTNGVPLLTSQVPVIGTTVTVSIGNSLGAPTIGLLFVGYSRAQLHTKFGGDLLLLPSLIVPMTFSFGTNSLTGTIPLDDVLCGVTLDFQVVEADPGAVLGVSFSPGLELILGR